MSVGSLIRGFSRLTVSAKNINVSSTHIYNHSHGIHSSSVCLRNLDNHARPPFKHPSSKNKRWEPILPFRERYEYTTKPLPFPKTGGRGPNGRIWTHRKGGGNKRHFRMIDWVRGASESGEPLVELVHSIKYDPNRSANIALVASGTHKRYIIATQNMKPGDLISSSNQVSKTPVRANEGDAHPVGSLPVGTLVNSVQRFPNSDARVATAAGCTAQVVRKMNNGKVIIRMPSKQEISVFAECQATVGRVSNIDHNKIVIGKAGRNRWFGIRPKSGRWHRKTGRFGRKIRPLPPVREYDKPAPPKQPSVPFTFN